MSRMNQYRLGRQVSHPVERDLGALVTALRLPGCFPLQPTLENLKEELE